MFEIVEGSMRIQLAIIFCLVLSPAMADDPAETSISTAVSPNIGPFSIGRPHTCAAYYPGTAVRAGAQGTDLVEFVITTSGSVKDIKIAKSSGNKDLDDATVTCVSHWLYKPARKDSAPIEIAWKANVVWNIAPPPAVVTALGCLYHRENMSAPPHLGQTFVGFRVMQDGTVTDVKVTQSSGNGAWDDVAVSCTQGRHYDVSIFTVPAEGLPAHLEMDWAGAVASLAPTGAPAQK